MKHRLPIIFIAAVCTMSATAILDRFLHHAEIITITGKSYRLKNKGSK